MKKLIAGLCAALLLASCGNDQEKKANEKLTAARAAFERGDYNDAKMQIDSIKLLYPKAFDTRKEGIKLMQQVELEEQQQSLIYLDSMLQVKTKELEAIKGSYVLEKDTAYQKTGNYFWPTQTVEKSLHRSFLRFQSSEAGVMTMTSIYCGGNNIHHLAVKVFAPDGSFAETPASKDSYETTDLGEKIEKADYKMGEDGNVMGFLYLNRDKNIRVQFLGERDFSTVMTPADRQALAGIYELSQLLSGITQIRKEIEEANLKIEFITRKMEQKNKEEATKGK